MQQRARILIIEDEADIANAVADRLRSEGHTVYQAADGIQGVESFRSLKPDLVVLDLMLPGMSGHEVCKIIQTERRTPVLMLTALDDETDVLVGLKLGADDYVTKPFSPRELAARVEAILRRVNGDQDRSSALHCCDLEIDIDSRRVTRDGAEVHLTPTEFDLLLGLAKANGTVLTREDLLTSVWGYPDGSGARTVDSHIRSLRRKLGDHVIRTVHGVGYAIGDQAA